MKVTIQKESDIISVDKVDASKHIVVMRTKYNQPWILTTTGGYLSNQFVFMCVHDQFVRGNYWGDKARSAYSSVQEAIEDQIARDSTVYAFENADWKKAMQFLINTCQ